MISNQIIQNCIDELFQITKTNFSVYDDTGLLASTVDNGLAQIDNVKEFYNSNADSQTVADCHFFKIIDDFEVAYILVSSGEGTDAYTMGRVAVSQIQNLSLAYKSRVDRTGFFQNLILDNLLLVDIHNKAVKLHIENDRRRIVYIIEAPKDNDNVSIELLKSLYVESAGNYVISVDEHNVILIKDIDSSTSREELDDIANTIVDLLNTEAMLNVRVSYGLPVSELKDVSKSYKEALMALDVGNIFYSQMKVLSYENLGIGRLIYQLPVNLCQIFVKEVFGNVKPEDIDEETLTTIEKFFENNLNVSETSRQLYIHRNTLVYRIEKLQKLIDLDMRVFEDALTFKIAMMVVEYMKYLEA